MDIATQMNYLIFGFKETGDATYLFKLHRILTEFLDDVIDDYLDNEQDCVLEGFNWKEDNTLKADLIYHITKQG